MIAGWDGYLPQKIGLTRIVGMEMRIIISMLKVSSARLCGLEKYMYVYCAFSLYASRSTLLVGEGAVKSQASNVGKEFES